MLNEHAQAWVTALRSGDYHQDFGYMHCGQCFDVLGVACDVWSRHTNGAQWAIVTNDGDAYQMLDYIFSLPNEVTLWLGLTDNLGWFCAPVDECTDLVSLSDKGWSFARLADFIASQPDGLFRQ